MTTRAAKKVIKKKEPKKPDYVASSYRIDYQLPYGLVGMLAFTSKKTEQEVWVIISELCNICAHRLSKKASQHSSWTSEMFPNTKIHLEIEMERARGGWNYQASKPIPADPSKLYCSIDLGFAETEKFTQEQVNTYITEKILLGDDDDE
jgi:hypothetical protein